MLFWGCNSGQVSRVTPDYKFTPVANLPDLPTPGVCAATTHAGAAVMLPFHPGKYGELEFAMFGGLVPSPLDAAGGE